MGLDIPRVQVGTIPNCSRAKEVRRDYATRLLGLHGHRTRRKHRNAHNSVCGRNVRSAKARRRHREEPIHSRFASHCHVRSLRRRETPQIDETNDRDFMVSSGKRRTAITIPCTLCRPGSLTTPATAQEYTTRLSN